MEGALLFTVKQLNSFVSGTAPELWSKKAEQVGAFKEISHISYISHISHISHIHCCHNGPNFLFKSEFGLFAGKGSENGPIFVQKSEF